MQSNNWERRLADQSNHVEERTSTAVSSGNRNEEIRKKLTTQFMTDVHSGLKNSISIFNESAKHKIDVINTAKDQRGDTYCGIRLAEVEIRFVNSGRGFIRVDLIDHDAVTEAAFILARLSRSGDFITWDEKNLLGFGNRLEPVTITHLVRKYVTLLVRH